MGGLSDLIAQAEARLADNSREKNIIMSNIGELEGEIAETTRFLAQKETERATVQFARPRTAELETGLQRLNYDVETLRVTLKTLEGSKSACLSKMRDLDVQLSGDRRVVEVCSKGGTL